jgi:hypothetical protein
MAKLTEKERLIHVENLNKIFQGGGTPRDAEDYLKGYGRTADEVLPKPMSIPDAPNKAPYVDPEAARLAGGMLAMGAGQAGPLAAVPEEIATVPLGGMLFAEGAKAFNRLMGSQPRVGAVEGMIEAGKQGVVDAASGAGVMAGGKLLKEAVRAPVRPLRAHGGGKNGASRLAQDFRETGISLSGQAGALTGNKGTQAFEMVLRKLPTSAAAYQNVDEAANAAFRSRGLKIAGELSSITEPFVAGKSVKRGLEGFADQVRGKGRALFGAVKQIVGPQTPVQPANTAAYVEELVAPFRQANKTLSPAARGNIPPAVRDLMSELEQAKGQPMTWERMDAIRRGIGERLADPTLIEPNSKGQLKRLYGVLSNDMEDAVQGLGENALKKWTAARNYWRAAMDRVDLIRDIAENDVTENAFRAVFAGEKNGPTLLRAVRKSVPRDVWNDVLATKIGQMMQAAPGQQNALGTVSSPARFLTLWNQMDATAKAVMFGADTPLRGQMDQLARVAEAIKDTAKESNFSNTGPFTYIANLLTHLPGTAAQAAFGAGAGAAAGVGGAATGTGLALATPYLSAKLFLHEPFVEWLAQASRIAMKTPQATTPTKAIALHFARLAAIEANAPKDEAAQIRAFRKHYESQVLQ